jgi:replicative DNA helicase
LEKAVLGALVLDKNAYARVAQLESIFFSAEKHQIVFSTFTEVLQKQGACDVAMLRIALKKSGKIEKVGGAIYLMSLIEGIASSANIEHHAAVIKEKYVLRQIEKRVQLLQIMLEDPAANPFEIVSAMQTDTIEISQNFESSVVRNMEDSKNDYIKELTTKVETLKSGIREFDILAKMQAGDLFAFAARPAMGKTATAVTLANNVNPAEVDMLIFSGEMTEKQFSDRVYSNKLSINGDKFIEQTINERELSAIMSDKNSHVFIDDSALSFENVVIKSRLHRLKYGFKKKLIICIDYLQLIRLSKKFGTRNEELGFVANSLKNLAKELKATVVPLLQLSRAVETRGGDKIPILSDIKESGDIEQALDKCVLLYRPSYYGLTTDSTGELITENDAHWILAKNRHGKTGTARISFYGEYSKFCSENEDVTEFSQEIAPQKDYFTTAAKIKEQEDENIPF